MRSVRLSLVIALLLSMAIGLTALADRKPLERLIQDLYDGIPEFRLANARALVAAYLFIGRTLEDLNPIIQKIEKERGFRELRQAVEEARQGKGIRACWDLINPEPPVVGGIDLRTKTVKELEELALFGATAQLREAATKMLINKYLTPKTKLYAEWYTYRIKAEPDFDAVKVQFYLWTVGAMPSARELITLALFPLAQIFFAEFLITLPDSQVRAKLKCP
ncbi:MAG: hypothetical protein NZO41_01000 [Candidatus Bipolaricaulota bacterium]|nr:hypothetical protein [Candidatus Bipolaricaulota bacterium]MDW8140925.1 hypothetical protein [Candidatus Bipolaricaulota bacterium]